MQHVPFTHCNGGTAWKPLPPLTCEHSLPKAPQGTWYFMLVSLILNQWCDILENQEAKG